MIAFEKVSKKQFLADCSAKGMADDALGRLYAHIALPKRATSGSAGYDFYLPFDLTLAPGESIAIPTGIRVQMPAGVVLLLVPRSGLGTRYRLQLANTVGVIDSDYYNALNEGHIQATLTNDSREGKTLTLAAGDRFMQGIFMPHLLCDDDQAARTQRLGGLGSTDQAPADQ